jgi:predicted nucleotidyltransferase
VETALVDDLKRLHGENRIGQFKEIGEQLKRKIGSFEGVSGIVFMGGLARGFADKYSDVDVTVFLAEKDESLRERIKKIGSDAHRRSGVDVDLEAHFLEDFKARKWSEIAKWDFSHAKVVFDPRGEVQKLLKTKLTVPNSYWLKRIVVYGEYVEWYCCPPKENDETLADLWVDRGDLTSAHYCLNYAITLLIRIIFALNKEFLPPPKWEIFHSYRLQWLPPNYKKLVDKALTVKSLSKHELNRRLRATRELWHEILPKIKEEIGLTPESIPKQYVKHVLKQG